MPFHSRVGLLLALLLAAATPAVAQSNAEVNAGIQFDFSLPGARSLAMGGAFVGLADDATAAWANPAGLTILNKKEVSAEFRGWNFTNFTTDRGHGFGVPSGIGADTVAGLLDTEFEDSTASLAFLSFVYPQPRWSVAAYRHQLSNFQARVQSSGPFLDSGGDIDRADPFAANLRLKIVDYGVSFGFRVTSRLSVGAGLGLHDFSNRLGHRPLSLRAAQSSPGRPAQCVHGSRPEVWCGRFLGQQCPLHQYPVRQRSGRGGQPGRPVSYRSLKLSARRSVRVLTSISPRDTSPASPAHVPRRQAARLPSGSSSTKRI